MAVDQVAALQRVGECQALVEVDHQVHVVADGAANGVEGRKVGRDALASQPQLQPCEAALVAQFQRLRGDGLRLLQPQAVAVVGLHRPDRAAEESAERLAAACASASHAAMSRPEAAIIDRPS